MRNKKIKWVIVNKKVQNKWGKEINYMKIVKIKKDKRVV